jgi:hypothetical protein
MQKLSWQRAARAGDYLPPTALAATDKTLFIACATANRVVSLGLSNSTLSVSGLKHATLEYFNRPNHNSIHERRNGGN